MKNIPLNEIPRESSRLEEVKFDQEELDALFEGIEDFDLVEPERAEGTLKLQRIGTHVRLAGWVMVPVAFVCGRCLSRRVLELEAELEYMLIPKAEWNKRYDAAGQRAGGGRDDDEEEEGGLGLSAADLGVAPYESDEVNPKPFVRESLLVELPTYPLCPEHLSGECEAAYQKNVGAKVLAQNEEEGIDPRWAELLKLKKNLEQGD